MMFTSRGEPEPPGEIGPVAAGADVHVARTAVRPAMTTSRTNAATNRGTGSTARSLGRTAPLPASVRREAGGLVPAEAHHGLYHFTPVLIRNTSARPETD